MQFSKIISIVLFIAAILTVPIAFSLACVIGNVEVFGFAGMAFLWLMLPFCSVPLGSLLFGIVMTKRGVRSIKNIVAGSVAATFALIVGASSFSFEIDGSGAFLREASATTGIALPEKVEASSYREYGGRVGNAIVLDIYEKSVFEEETRSGRWSPSLTPAMKTVLPAGMIAELGSFEAYCLYVSPLGEFSPEWLPRGEYEITFLSYKRAKGHLRIFDSYHASV